MFLSEKRIENTTCAPCRPFEKGNLLEIRISKEINSPDFYSDLNNIFLERADTSSRHVQMNLADMNDRSFARTGHVALRSYASRCPIASHAARWNPRDTYDTRGHRDRFNDMRVRSCVHREYHK